MDAKINKIKVKNITHGMQINLTKYYKYTKFIIILYQNELQYKKGLILLAREEKENL